MKKEKETKKTTKKEEAALKEKKTEEKKETAKAVDKTVSKKEEVKVEEKVEEKKAEEKQAEKSEEKVEKAKVIKKKGKKEKVVPSNGRVYVTATFNNTLVTITDPGGNTVVWGSAGTSGFKGARKATPFAATTAVEAVARKALGMGMRDVEVFIKGPGPGRDSAIRALRAAGLNITMIADVTPIPHNGTRSRKRRRV